MVEVFRKLKAKYEKEKLFVEAKLAVIDEMIAETTPVDAVVEEPVPVACDADANIQLEGE